MADTEVLAQAMQTKMPSNPVDRVVQQRADVAEKKAGIDADVAQKSMDLNAPIDTSYKGKVEDTQQLLSSIGKQIEKPFQLPQETTADFAEIGGLVAVVGVMLGSSGKMSANNVLGSITGLMEGYKKGRADVVANSYKEFETNMKRLQTQAQNATAQLDNYTKLVAVDREAANRVLAQFKAEQNQGIASESSKAESGFDAIKTKAELQKMANHQAELTQKVRKDVADAMVNHQVVGADGVRKYLDPRDMTFKPVPDQMTPVPKPTSAKSAAGGGLNGRFAWNITEAYGQAAIDILNLAEAPAGTFVGSLADLSGKGGAGLTEGLSSTFAREVTPEDSRMLQQMISGLDVHMGRALGAGYANSSASKVIQAYKDQVPREGDSPAITAMFLARVRQELEMLARSFESHPGKNDEELKLMRGYTDNIRQAIPFTVQDVLAAYSKSSAGGKERRPTNSEVFRGLASSPVNNPLPVDKGGGQDFNSAEDVKAALKAGRISKDAALQILKDQFGYK